MEKKQLNFSAPLLSVRRYSSPQPSLDRENRKVQTRFPPSRNYSIPTYQSDSKSDQDAKPGVVPFVWEQIPGRPKGHSGPLPRLQKELSITPRLPPGRVSDLVHQPVEKESEDHYVLTPRSQELYLSDSVTKWEGLKEGVDMEGDPGSDSSDDAYSDAMDTLSPGESSTWNCSVSGLSGSDGPAIKPSGTFSTDSQTRDFMMKRFLPAAKAMTLETPQYASRKQHVAPELPSHREHYRDRRPSLNQYGSNIIPSYHHEVEEEASEDEDDDYYDDSRNSLVKACGLVSRFSLKNSFCLSNLSVPGMKSKTRSPRAEGIRYKNVSKLAWNADHKQKLGRIKSLEPPGLGHKLTAKSHQLNYRSDLLAKNLSFPYRHSADGGVSPYRNQAPQSPFRGKGFLGVPNKVENFKDERSNFYAGGSRTSGEVFRCQENYSGSGSGSPVVEKTLYVDSVNIVKARHSFSSSSDTKGLTCSADEDLKDLEESKGVKERLISEISTEDIECLDGAKEKLKLRASVSGPLEASSLHMSPLRARTSTMEQESKSLECSKEPTSGNPATSNEQILGAEIQGNSTGSSLNSPLPPPLPKSPSESWLWRALPSMPSKKPFSHLYVRSQSPLKAKSPVTAPTGSKWETIVKTSKLHKDHARYSEELITHVSQQSKP